MTATSAWARLRERIGAFTAAEGGNAMMLFGLALVPLLAATGVAVDYGRASAARTEMQAALDYAALSVSKDAQGLAMVDLSETQKAAKITTLAQAYFNSMFVYKGMSGVSVTAKYTKDGFSRIDMTASGTLQTEFMRIFGRETVDIGTATTTNWGTKRLRVALVLDNTGSMGQAGKLTALKSATKSLLKSLKGKEQTVGDVYVSLIPFAKNVNIGTGLNATPTTRDTILRWDLLGTTDKTAWAGCVTDRDQDNDVNASAPTAGVRSTQFPAVQGACPASKVMPLTADWTGLNDAVDRMNANGNTNQTIGLQWGFQSLVGSAPLSAPSKDPKYDYDTYVILLTDGLNTENRWTSSQSTIDQRTEKLCGNVKSAGITLFTIQVNTGGDPTSAMLQRCASPGQYYPVNSAGGIQAAFDAIDKYMSDLRLAS